MELTPIEQQQTTGLRRRLIAAGFVFVAAIVAVVGSLMDIAVSTAETRLVLDGVLGGVGERFGSDGDLTVVRILAMVLIGDAVAILLVSRRSWTAAAATLITGACVLVVGQQWWRLITGLPKTRIYDGRISAFSVGGGVYAIFAAGVLAIIGAVVAWRPTLEVQPSPDDGLA